MTRVARFLTRKGTNTDDATTSRGFCVRTPEWVSLDLMEIKPDEGHTHVNENLLHVPHGVSPSHRIYNP